MTNKPMLSVEREVIEKALRDALTIRFDTDSQVTKLRSLLDKPPAVRHNNVMPDWLKERFGEIEDDAMILSGCAVFTKMRTKTQAYFDMARCEISPVTCVIAFREGVKEPELLSWNQLPVGEHQLYAEQPAPVAPFDPDTVVCRRYTLEQSPGQNFYHYDIEPVYGSVPVTISDLIDIAESDPVAAVMPERRAIHTAWDHAYNSALYDVARLNEVKP